VVEDAACSASLQDLAFYAGGKYPVIVRETRDGETKEITRKQVSKGNWVIMALYTTK
jgi:hypothetical protein